MGSAISRANRSSWVVSLTAAPVEDNLAMSFDEMTGQSEVSIITIFLDAEKYLREAVESVFSQTYEHWELLLVDDGSADGSSQIALDYASQFPGKVRYFDHPGHHNLGKSASRNLGIRKAAGKYLVFLDADDVLLPEKLERQVAALEAQPEAAMVYGRTLYWYSWTGDPRDQRRDYLSKLGVTPGKLYQPPALLVRYLLDGGTVPCLCSPLLRRDCAQQVGGFDESIQNLYEDQVFLAKVCLHAPVLVEAECGERYRQHPNSSSYLAIKKGEYDPFKPNPARLAFLNWLAQYLHEQGVEDAPLKKALSKEYRPFRFPRIFRLAGLAQGLISQAGRRLDSARKQVDRE